MGFLDPKKEQDEDDALPGSGVHLDLDVKMCPACRREVLPWQTTCPDCGTATVAPTEMPPRPFPLPHLDDASDAGDDDAGDGAGTE